MKLLSEKRGKSATVTGEKRRNQSRSTFKESDNRTDDEKTDTRSEISKARRIRRRKRNNNLIRKTTTTSSMMMRMHK